jgi:uncharacterized membrane protein
MDSFLETLLTTAGLILAFYVIVKVGAWLEDKLNKK